MITLRNARYCTAQELIFLRKMKSDALDPCAKPIRLLDDTKQYKGGLFYDFNWDLPMFDVHEVLQAHADSQMKKPPGVVS